MPTFCAIDFETANGRRASVCAVGLARFDAATGELLASDGGLVTPPAVDLRTGERIDEFGRGNMMVHHISPRKIRSARDGRGAPTWHEVLPWIRRFVGDDLLVAHNAAFERGVLREASLALGLEVPTVTQHLVCTVKIAKHELAHLPRHKLPLVVEALGLPPMGSSHHDAVADAVACGRIAAALVQREHVDLLELARRSGQQVRQPTLMSTTRP